MKFSELPNVVSIPNDYWVDVIRPMLLRSEYAPVNANDDINDFVFYDNGDIILPKYFWHTIYPKFFKKHFLDKSYIKQLKYIQPTSIESVKLKEGVKPRSYQNEVITPVFDMWEKTNHIRCVIQGTTGFGKTFVALYLIAHLKIKPIIIVHNETLFKQWQGAIDDFLDIDKDRIGIIQGSNVKKIKKELEKDIIIVKVQSLLSQVKRIPLTELYELYKDISIVFEDEVHISGSAQKYGKVNAIFRTLNIIGLSATPDQKGTHKLLLETNIGTTVLKSSHRNLVPKVVLKILSGCSEPSILKRMEYVREYVQKLALYNNAMTSSSKFIHKIITDAIDHVKNENRRILIIAANNTMVAHITERLILAGINAKQFTAKHKDIKDAQVIVSNNQMSSTGFSEDSLDTLYLCNGNVGKTLLIQTAGRIVRLYEGKKSPLMHLYFDELYLKKLNNKLQYIVKNNISTEYKDGLEYIVEQEGENN